MDLDLFKSNQLFSELSESNKQEFLNYLQQSCWPSTLSPSTTNPYDNTTLLPQPTTTTSLSLEESATTTTSSPRIVEMEVNNLQEQILQYVKNNNPKLYILTPCYGSQCYVNYIVCLISTLEVFQKIGFPVQVEFCRNDSLVPRARNNLIARAMSDPLMTHMLFIDTDITWNPIDVLKLIIDDKPINGGVYPLKKYNWQNLYQSPNIVEKWIETKNKSVFKDIFSDEEVIQSKLLKYNVNFLRPSLNIENNLTMVKHIANGFMMIQRNTISEMQKQYPKTKYTDDVGFLKENENEFAYALFDCGVVDDHYLSEDWFFCNRWTNMGGSIFINISINLSHTGCEDFKGSLITSLV